MLNLTNEQRSVAFWLPLSRAVNEPLHCVGLFAIGALGTFVVLFLVACLPPEEVVEQQQRQEEPTAQQNNSQRPASKDKESAEQQVEQPDLQEKVEQDTQPQSQQSAEQVVSAQPAQPPVVYVVKASDTLSRIARDHGVTVAELAEFNSIDDPNLLRIGQKIRIPTLGSESSCPTAEEAAYFMEVLTIFDFIQAATDVLEREFDGAVPSDRGRGEWSGFVSTASLDLSDATERIEAISAPDSVADLHGDVLKFGRQMWNRQGEVFRFISASTDDSDPATQAIRKLATDASALRDRLVAFCVDQGGGSFDHSTVDADVCPDEAEEQYFAQMDQAFAEINSGLLRLLALNEEFAADFSLLRDEVWRSRLVSVGQTISDATDAVILLEQPLGVRYSVGLEYVYLAEDVALAASLYRLAIEYESPDLMIQAGEEFIALKPRIAAVASAVEQYCE